MNQENEKIKENMKEAQKDLVSAYVVTISAIKKLEGTIKETDKLLSQFKL